MFNDLENKNKELVESLETTKRSLKRSNVAVKELFARFASVLKDKSYFSLISQEQ